MKDNLLDQQLLQSQLERTRELERQRQDSMNVSPEALDATMSILPEKPVDYSTFQSHPGMDDGREGGMSMMGPEDLARQQEMAAPDRLEGLPDLSDEIGIKEDMPQAPPAGASSAEKNAYQGLLKRFRDESARRDKDVIAARENDRFNQGIANIANIIGTASNARLQADVGIPLGLKGPNIQLPETAKLAEQDSQSRLRNLMGELSILRQAEAREDDPTKLMRIQLMQQNLMERMEDRKRKADQFQQSFENRQEEEENKKIEKISTRLEKSGVLGKTRAFDEIDGYLMAKGVDLTNPDKKAVQTLSIEGMGVAGGLRPDFLTDTQDVNFRQNVQGLANQLLKDRSGAAVTDQEYARFLKEVGSGNFSDERALVQGLRKMRTDLANQTKNITKSFGKNAEEQFIERTGVNLLTDSPKSQVRQEESKAPYGERVTRNGKNYIWNAAMGRYLLDQ